MAKLCVCVVASATHHATLLSVLTRNLSSGIAFGSLFPLVLFIIAKSGCFRSISAHTGESVRCAASDLKAYAAWLHCVDHVCSDAHYNFCHPRRTHPLTDAHPHTRWISPEPPAEGVALLFTALQSALQRLSSSPRGGAGASRPSGSYPKALQSTTKYRSDHNNNNILKGKGYEDK